LRLIATGYSNAEIARRLVVNERTVEKTIARLIKQLDVQTDKDQNQRVVLTQIYFRLIGVVGSRNL
jgi:DNA-binding NarL/FixJ family response regulator